MWTSRAADQKKQLQSLSLSSTCKNDLSLSICVRLWITSICEILPAALLMHLKILQSEYPYALANRAARSTMEIQDTNHVESYVFSCLYQQCSQQYASCQNMQWRCLLFPWSSCAPDMTTQSCAPHCRSPSAWNPRTPNTIHHNFSHKLCKARTLLENKCSLQLLDVNLHDFIPKYTQSTLSGLRCQVWTQNKTYLDFSCSKVQILTLHFLSVLSVSLSLSLWNLN